MLSLCNGFLYLKQIPHTCEVELLERNDVEIGSQFNKSANGAGMQRGEVVGGAGSASSPLPTSPLPSSRNQLVSAALWAVARWSSGMGSRCCLCPLQALMGSLAECLVAQTPLTAAWPHIDPHKKVLEVLE